MTASKSKTLDNIRILVVDDVDDIRELLSLILVRQGATVETAGSVREALAIMPEFAPDVLVSDISMPEQDGYDLIRIIRQSETTDERSGLPAIAISAYTDTFNSHRSLAAGYQVHMAKPIDQRRLVKLVARLVELDGEAVKHQQATLRDIYDPGAEGTLPLL